MDWIISMFSGAFGIAFMTGVFKLIEVRMNHKANKKQEKRLSVDELHNKHSGEIDTIRLALRIILHDRIKHLARAYIRREEVTFDDRKDLIDMHSVYHNELDGNGNLDSLMEVFMEVKII